MADLDNAPPRGSVTVVNVEVWRVRARELAALLSVAGHQPEGARFVRAPAGAAKDGPIEIATVADPGYWSANPAELADALTPDSATSAGAPHRSSVDAAPPGVERLTLTVEEAATILGISRAGAYEAVQRGEIPSIRIGRRILVPRAALNKLVGIDPTDGTK